MIPALLNCSLVLYLTRNDVLEDGWEKITSHSLSHHVARNGVLLLAFYMALFSNLYESAILAAYIGSQLILKLLTLLKTGGTLKSYIKNNILRIVFIAAWLVEQLFEANGGRARQLTASLVKTGGFSFTDVIATLRAMAARVGTINKFFVIGSILIIISSLAIYGFNRIGGKPLVKNTYVLLEINPINPISLGGIEIICNFRNSDISVHCFA